MTDETLNDAPANRGPEDTLRDGHLKAAIWKNEAEQGHFFSTTLGRTYEDQDGNLKDSRSFGTNDLLRVSELARGAYARSRELEREQSQERQPEQDREQRKEQFEAQRRDGEPSQAKAHDRSR